jgi:alginate O-acetyltransferase complex protein AlgJ
MLEERGVTLVLFPVPDKSALQPEPLDARAERATTRLVPVNLGAARFAAELRAQGVALFDPTPLRLERGEPPRFLIQDTHWTPGWMQAVAGELAHFVLRTRSLPPPLAAFHYHAVPTHVERVGDLVDMLKLPDDQRLFTPQSVTVTEWRDEAEAPWAPDPTADVLLLGDSFTNVFSLDAMGWGEAAGLAPQLSAALGRNVDVIAQNDSGAFATRQILARALAAGEDPLRGKRVVIWEFAARELSVGDWRPILWPRNLGAASAAR